MDVEVILKKGRICPGILKHEIEKKPFESVKPKKLSMFKTIDSLI